MKHKASSEWPMLVLYDGACPFCSREIEWLRRRNTDLRLAFADISRPEFDLQRYGLTRDEVMTELCGVLADGTVARGAETVRRTYEAVGLAWLAAPTRWPGLRWLTDRSYAAFARNRVCWGKYFGHRCPAESACPADGE